MTHDHFSVKLVYLFHEFKKHCASTLKPSNIWGLPIEITDPTFENFMLWVFNGVKEEIFDVTKEIK